MKYDLWWPDRMKNENATRVVAETMNRRDAIKAVAFSVIGASVGLCAPEKVARISREVGMEEFPDGLVSIRPYMIVRVSDSVDLVPVWLQYDAPSTLGLHKRGELRSYLLLPQVEVAPRVVTYLAKAVKRRPDDIRMESPYYDGVLWGWFPKEYAS